MYNNNLNEQVECKLNVTEKMKNGERVMIGSGEHACSIEARLTLEESRRRLDDELYDAIYSKPVAFVKKIVRKIQTK